jgi:hypothetical protein
MSSGATFKIIANDGKADRMIMATKLLNQRIRDVMCARKQAGKVDITPTLVDLERTHILFVNAHFKPFAAIGYEYQVQRPNSGQAALGSGVTFSIPQFGDFFHDMMVRVRLTAVQANIAPIPRLTLTQISGAPTPPGQIQTLVDAFGNEILATTPGPNDQMGRFQNMVHYCEFPGNRLFRNVRFDVNGNPLDAYTEFVPVMHEKFFVKPNKRVGYNRLVGQEVPLQGLSGLSGTGVIDFDSANTPRNVISKYEREQSNMTVGLYSALNRGINSNVAGSNSQMYWGVNWQSATPINLNPDTVTSTTVAPYIQDQYDVSRKALQFVNGPQTPKPIQPPLEIFNKLHFWFNDDVRLSIPSVSIPFGQRFITVDLNTQDQLIYEFPSLYVKTITTTVPNINVDSGVGPGIVTSTFTPYPQLNGIQELAIDAMELYINNIFVNPEIHDIFIKRIGFSLIRVYREQRTSLNRIEDLLLSQLKWPIEYMMVGCLPAFNVQDVNYNVSPGSPTGYTSTGNPFVWHDWHRFTRQVFTQQDRCGCPIRQQNDNLNNLITYDMGKVTPDIWWQPVSTIDSLTIIAHGIKLYDNFQDKFYNQYLPYHYGADQLMTPDDTGALFINYCLFPRSYQPSGHLNMSRSRETYINIKSKYISSASPVDLIVVALAINFLLITDGSAVLRYST